MKKYSPSLDWQEIYLTQKFNKNEIEEYCTLNEEWELISQNVNIGTKILIDNFVSNIDFASFLTLEYVCDSIKEKELQLRKSILVE